MTSIIFVVLGLLSFSFGQETILENPILTNWGEWFAWENCTEGTVAIGLALKSHEYQTPIYDDTAMNGIRFYCRPPGWETPGITAVHSGQGEYGVFGSQFLCPRGTGFMTGFAMRSEEDQQLLDDMAGCNMRLYCNGEKNAYVQADGLEYGIWTAARHCPDGQAVCGIQTQVEAAGTNDDTSLNNFRAKCCPIPSPAKICSPSESWEKIQICDNTFGTNTKACKFEKRVGSGYSPKGSNVASEIEFYKNAGHSIKAADLLADLKENVLSKLQKSSETLVNWSQMSFETQDKNGVSNGEIYIPAGSKVTLYQAITSCGIFTIRSDKMKQVITLNGEDKVSYLSI